MWENMCCETKLLLLSAASTVAVQLLAEDDVLLGLIQRGESQAVCEAHVNENY